MVRFEIKKVLSRTGGKIALLLLLALVLLECSFAFDGTYVNSEGVSTHGIAAVRPLRAEQKKWEGVLDEQRIAQVIGELNRIEALPEAKSDDLIDEEITYSRKQGVSAIRLLLNCSYATGFRDYDYYLADSLTPEQAKDFYPNRIRLLKAWLAGEAKDQFSDEEKQFLIARYEALETPFSYAYNEGWSQLLYVLDPLNATMPIILCLVVCALNVAMLMRSPTNWFISVDFPTFGFPTMFTNPALCILSVFFICKYTEKLLYAKHLPFNMRHFDLSLPFVGHPFRCFCGKLLCFRH